MGVYFCIVFFADGIGGHTSAGETCGHSNKSINPSGSEEDVPG